MENEPNIPNSNPLNPLITETHKSVSHWFAAIALIIAVIGYFLVSYSLALWPFGGLSEPVTTPQPVQRACTQEAKLCPDGSYVGRIGPNCEFALCPSETVPTDWKTYRNEEYGFELRYPDDGKLTQDKVRDYDRIQNYISIDNVGGLKSGEYYIEIFTSGLFGSCSNLGIENPSYGVIGDIEVTIGFGPYGGDMGGDRRTLCVDNKIVIQATFEPDSQSLVDQILSTFRFIPSTGSGQVSSPLPIGFNWPKLTKTTLGVGAVSYELIGDATRWGKLNFEGEEWSILCFDSDCRSYSDWKSITDYESIEAMGWVGWGSGDIIYKGYKLKPIIGDGAGSTVQGFIKIEGDMVKVYVYSVNASEDSTEYRIFLSQEYDLNKILP